MNPHEQEIMRMQLIERHIPTLFTMPSCLYIGGSPGKLQLVRYLTDYYELHLLEAHYPNYEAMLNTLDSLHFEHIIHGDVRDISSNQFIQNLPFQYQTTVWWHGPEHVELDLLPVVLEDIGFVTRDLIVLGCPYGRYEQGAVNGNEYEIHRSTLYPEFFQDLGYKVATQGERDAGLNTCILAWKWLS